MREETQTAGDEDRTTADVVSVGSVNVDLVGRLDPADVDRLAAYDAFPARDETRAVETTPPAFDEVVDRTLLGGKGANQAVAAAAAGAGTALCGRVGPDAADHDVRGSLRERGVDVSRLETVDVETGKAYVLVEPGGETRIAIRDGANGAVDASFLADRRDAVGAAAVVLLQNEIPVDAAVALLDALAGTADPPTVIVDPSPADGAAHLVDHPATDVVVPNGHEAEVLADALAAFDGTVVRTRGAEPTVVDPADGDRFTVTPPSVDPVDTTGAGDAFVGYLAADLSAAASLRAATATAAVAGALSTTAEGAQTAVPDRSAVENTEPRVDVAGR